MIKSSKQYSGVFLFAENIRIGEGGGIIILSGKYVCIHGKDILNIHLIGYSDRK